MIHLKTITITIIYINCLLIDYELKNKLKLIFRIINIKIELVMPRQHFLRDQSLLGKEFDKDHLAKTCSFVSIPIHPIKLQPVKSCI